LTGSSVGRGGRAAGWFQDYIKEQGKEGEMESSTLTGGIKGWVAAGEEYVALVDGYESSEWSA
jgi:arsenical-resistance protein 2